MTQRQLNEIDSWLHQMSVKFNQTSFKLLRNNVVQSIEENESVYETIMHFAPIQLQEHQKQAFRDLCELLEFRVNGS